MRWALPIVLALSVSLTEPSEARAAPRPLADLDPADEAALDVLARYPEPERRAILLAATRPELLIEAERIRSRTRSALDQLLGQYDQKAQELLWSLVPHPALVAEIVAAKTRSRAALEAIVSRQPEEVREAAVQAGETYPRALARIHALHASAERDFEALIADLPSESQQAFRTLLARPEALSLLAEHAAMTVLLGDAFERNPEQTSEWLRARGEERAEAGAADPEAAAALEGAARGDTAREPSRESTTVVSTTSVHVYAYPYWFGYPSWMAIQYAGYAPWYWWYPRVYWPWCGSSFGPRYGFAGVRYPSYGYPAYHSYAHWGSQPGWRGHHGSDSWQRSQPHSSWQRSGQQPSWHRGGQRSAGPADVGRIPTDAGGRREHGRGGRVSPAPVAAPEPRPPSLPRVDRPDPPSQPAPIGARTTHPARSARGGGISAASEPGSPPAPPSLPSASETARSRRGGSSGPQQPGAAHDFSAPSPGPRMNGRGRR